MYDCDTCDKQYNNHSSLSSHYTQYPEHKPDDWKFCPDCNIRQGSMGNHWLYTECKPPSLTKLQRNIITGIMMGDGSINPGTKAPKVQCEMKSYEYLNYIDRELYPYSTGVKKTEDAWYWSSVCHESMREFDSWYCGIDRNKVFPENIELTPEVLKHWYCCDGGILNYESPNNQFYIASLNEMENKEKVGNYFDRAGLPREYWIDHKIVFSIEDSKQIFKYIGKPTPGFEYKWPKAYR